jgi:hypothetical protein
MPKTDRASSDESMPCFREVAEWPIQPQRPGRIVEFGRYRDGGPRGGTFYVVLAGINGVHVPFFFDRFLGRLCYGANAEVGSDAAFLKGQSKIEVEAFELLESASRSSSKFKEVLECLTHARTWVS